LENSFGFCVPFPTSRGKSTGGCISHRPFFPFFTPGLRPSPVFPFFSFHVPQTKNLQGVLVWRFFPPKSSLLFSFRFFLFLFPSFSPPLLFPPLSGRDRVFPQAFFQSSLTPLPLPWLTPLRPPLPFIFFFFFPGFPPLTLLIPFQVSFPGRRFPLFGFFF